MMKRKGNIAACTYLILLLSYNVVFGQTVTQVSKMPCSGNNRYYIDVDVRENGRILDSLGRKYYDYSSIYRLADSSKIKIIEKIFEFASDTSLCCNEVRVYENADYPGCFNEMPSANNFSIRVEALFIINRIAYNSLTFRIGCYPVLYDSETMQEINKNNCLINIMVERYKEWFRIYKETGKLPLDYNYFNRGRIKWWGKHLSNSIKPLVLDTNRDYARASNNTNYFGFDLGYDKANNNLIGDQTYAAAQYNGNIAGTVWKRKGDGEKRKYDFSYDAVNRLSGALFSQYTNSVFNTDAGVDFSVTNMSDDANGNIKTMNQNGLGI